MSPWFSSPPREEVRFGVELELTALPESFYKGPSQTEQEFWKRGYDALGSVMKQYDIENEVTRFYPNRSFKKYPSSYEHWFVTCDSSVKPKDGSAIPIEVVSRIFDVPKKDWMDEITKFWDAFYRVFKIECSNPTCGSHIHISPTSPSFDIGQLRRIAYAVIIYEKHILEIMSKRGRDHSWCNPNSEFSPTLKKIFRGGRNEFSYAYLKQEIRNLDTPNRLYEFMQGNSDQSKYVLWNFENLTNPNKGTIEFRGIPGVHSAQETIHWILFAVGFILLAEEEDKLGRDDNWTYVKPGTSLLEKRSQELWDRINESNKRRFTKKWKLPDMYSNTLDRESRSRVRSSSRSTSRSRSGSRERSWSRQVALR